MSLRTERVGESVREVLAEELPRLTDPGLGFLSITGVEVSPDLRQATVFFSVLGTEDSLKETEAALCRARIRLQSTIGRRLRLKRTPKLSFRPDLGIIQGERMDATLRELHASDDPRTES